MVGRVRHVNTLIYYPPKLSNPLPHPVPQLRRGSLEGFSVVDCHMDYAVVHWINMFFSVAERNILRQSVLEMHSFKAGSRLHWCFG